MRNCGTLIEKGQDKEITDNINLEEAIQAPIQKGQKLGEVEFTLNGELISKVNIIANQTIEKMNIINMAKCVYGMWFNLLR